MNYIQTYNFFKIFKYENFEVLTENDIYMGLKSIFSDFTFQKKYFHEIISKPNKTLWPNLSSLP